MLVKKQILFLSVLALSLFGSEACLHARAMNHAIIQQTEFAVEENFLNNGDIIVKSLSVDADFKNRDGYVEADKIFVTASCNNFENCNILKVSNNITFADPETRITLSVMTRINALYKGDDYMGGIDCWFGKKNLGTLTIINQAQKHVFEGSASDVKEALNKGLNKTASVTALIAYLRQFLTQKNLVAAAALRR
jgi:hypothetical protein